VCLYVCIYGGSPLLFARGSVCPLFYLYIASQNFVPQCEERTENDVSENED